MDLEALRRAKREKRMTLAQINIETQKKRRRLPPLFLFSLFRHQQRD